MKAQKPKIVLTRKAVPAAKAGAVVHRPLIHPTTQPAALNAKQLSTRRNKAKEANLKLRKELWPEAGETELWLREDRNRKGFTTMPRTMPLLMDIINDASKQVTTGQKAVPAGKSYLVLWCRVFDEGFLRIDSEASAALEAGYGGERNVSTWREHLRVLKELGFIDCKPGAAGPYQFVLIWNPYHVVKRLQAKGWVQEFAYTTLLQRTIEIGATDLDEGDDARPA
jgi:hypothetical protein